MDGLKDPTPASEELRPFKNQAGEVNCRSIFIHIATTESLKSNFSVATFNHSLFARVFGSFEDKLVGALQDIALRSDALERNV